VYRPGFIQQYADRRFCRHRAAIPERLHFSVPARGDHRGDRYAFSTIVFMKE